MSNSSMALAFLILGVAAGVEGPPSQAELAAMSADDACHADAGGEACSVSLRQLRGLHRTSEVAAHNASKPKGFCCYSGALKSNLCGTCHSTEGDRAEAGSYCDSADQCGGCGGEWCAAVCVMSADNPEDPCGSAYKSAIAESDHYCAKSKESCEGCKGHWCGRSTKMAVSSKSMVPSKGGSATEAQGGGGFCCYDAPNKADTCGTCYTKAMAPLGDTCANAEMCSKCKGTWCKASCVLGAGDPQQPCKTAFQKSIAADGSFCSLSQSHCTKCKGAWCGAGEAGELRSLNWTYPKGEPDHLHAKQKWDVDYDDIVDEASAEDDDEFAPALKEQSVPDEYDW